MLPVQDRPRAAFTVLVSHAVLALIHSCTGQSQLIGPSQPVVVLAGEDVILRCHLQPAVDASNLLVEWARPDLDPRFVLVWRDGVELQSKKHPSYRGRTSLFTDELKHGNVSLKLSPVMRSDAGTYRCFIPHLHRDLNIRLVVGVVSSPVIQISSISSVLLQCESAGWYPEPELLWLDAEGSVLPAAAAETLRRPDGLYNVSSRATVEKRHGSNFTCRVQQKSINQSRETHLHVPDHFFMVPSTPGPPGPPGPPAVLIGSAVGYAALLLIPAVIFAVWRWRLNKSRNRRRSPEDGPEQTLTAQSENSGLQLVMEGGEESVTLMAGREEEKDADDGGEESRSLLTEADRDGPEGEFSNEQVPLIPAEQQQDTTGTQRSQDEGEQTEPGGEDSGLQHVHNDQEELKQQDTTDDEDEREAKDRKRRNKKTEQQKVRKGGSALTGQKKKQKERKRPDLNSRRNLNPEMERRKEGGRDETELKPQREEESPTNKQEGNLSLNTSTTEKKAEEETVKRERELQSEEQENTQTELKPQREEESQHLLGVRKHERNKAEHEDKDKQEGSLSLDTSTTGRQAEEETEKLKEKREREHQSEVSQQVLDGSKQEAEHEDERGNEADITAGTERKEEKETETKEEKETETKGEKETETKGEKETETKEEKETETKEEKETETKEEKETETKKVENERKLQSQRQTERREKEKRAKGRRKLISQRNDPNQTTDSSRNQEGEQSNRGMKGEKPESQKVKTSDGSKDTEIQRSDRETTPPSVRRRGTERPELELQAETQQERKPGRNQGESKEQPEESTEQVKVDWKAGQEELLGTNEGSATEQTRQDSQPQTVQQDIQEQIEEFFRKLTERGAECQRGEQEEEMEYQEETQSKRNIGEKLKGKQENEPQGIQSYGKRNRLELCSRKTQNTKRKEKPKQVLMQAEVGANMKRRMDESQGFYSHTLQGEAQEEQMDI